MSRRLVGLAVATALLVMPASTALAAPVTVNVRIEGSATTLFEGPVTTDAKAALSTPSSAGLHPCNVGQNVAPPNATRAPNATTALADAAASAGLPWDAGWSTSSFGNDFFVTHVGPDAATTMAFWGFAVDYKPAQVGGCQLAVGNGAEVLWAYDFFRKPRLLRLSGPASAPAGTPFTVTVRDGQSGAPVAAATVGGATTDAAGNAQVTLSGPGLQRLKAEAAQAVRSNALVVCVHRANDGTCGTTPGQGAAGARATRDTAKPRSQLLSPRNARRYRRARFVPRAIRGTVEERGSGLLSVKLRLTRRMGDRCWYFSGRRERFVRRRCRFGFFFRIGQSAPFSYLLPERLPRGRYVLDVVAVDRAGNRESAPRRGRNRVVFEVR